jgi:DNA-binding CsgD family transcriptional regulator
MGNGVFWFPGRQAVLDASLRLQLVRAGRCDEWAAGRRCGAEVHTFSEHEDLQGWLHEQCLNAEELVAVTSTRYQTVEKFVPSHRVNRDLVERGVRMTSFFDPSGGLESVTDFLVAAEEMPYYIACGPIQMKVFDGERVLVEGPEVDGRRSLMMMTGADAVNATKQYLRAVRGSAIRACELRGGDVDLTPRQHVIAGQLSDGCTDDQIAERLDVSVRTVRYEVSRLLEILDVRTRFAAGVRYARMTPPA